MTLTSYATRRPALRRVVDAQVEARGRVVDEHVDRPERVGGLRPRSRSGRSSASERSATIGTATPAGRGDGVGGLPQRSREVPARTRLEAPGDDRDAAPFGREPPRDGGADAAGRPGDEGNPAGKCITHGCWTIVGPCST